MMIRIYHTLLDQLDKLWKYFEFFMKKDWVPIMVKSQYFYEFKDSYIISTAIK